MKISKNLVSESKYDIKCPYKMDPEYIAVHNTANDASAQNEVAYMIRNDNQVSFHYAVDETEAVQGLPLDRNGWHAGDGANGDGNRKSIAVEICRSTGDLETFKKCEENAVTLIANLLKERDWGVEKVKKHQDFSNKNCPHRTIELGWERFKLMIENELKGSEVEKPTTNTASGYTGNSLVDYLKSIGEDSSYSNRSKLAKENGISGYSGTAEQNTKLLGILREEKSTSSTTTKPTGYTGNSIVDYLKSIGEDSSFANRSKLAKQKGMTSYGGTAEQNNMLLKMLRGF